MRSDPWDEKLHAVVARSTFPNQIVQNPKHTNVGPLLAVVMSKKCTLVVARSTCPSQNAIRHTMFGPLLEVDMLDKVHAVVAQSTFQSQKCWKLTVSEHFWKLTCRKSARCCGAMHMFEVKSAKHWGVRSTFGRSDVVLRGRQKGFCTLSKVSKTWGFCSSFNYNHHCTTVHFTIPQLQLHYTTLHYATLHEFLYTTLHYTPLHSTPLHSTPQHQTTFNYTTLHYTKYNCNYTTTLH